MRHIPSTSPLIGPSGRKRLLPETRTAENGLVFSIAAETLHQLLLLVLLVLVLATERLELLPN